MSDEKTRRRVIRLRRSGLSYACISKRLGVSTSTANRWCDEKYAKQVRVSQRRSFLKNKEAIRLSGLRTRARRAGEPEISMTAGELKTARKLHSGLCDICSEKHKVLDVDHDHKTGSFRGFLCRRCNGALGGFKDSVVTLKSAISYLEGKK